MRTGKQKMEGIEIRGAWNIGTGIQKAVFSGLMALCRLLSLFVVDKPQTPEVCVKTLLPGQFEFDVQTCEYHILAFDEAIDLASSPAVRQKLLLALTTYQHLIVDFTRLPYLDSAGIAVFLEAQKIAKSQSRSMVFVGVQGRALQLMELTQLNQVFTLLDSVPKSLIPQTPAPQNS